MVGVLLGGGNGAISLSDAVSRRLRRRNRKKIARATNKTPTTEPTTAPTTTPKLRFCDDVEVVWLPLLVLGVVPPLGVDCPLECDVVTELPGFPLFTVEEFPLFPLEFAAVEVPWPPPEFAVPVPVLVGTVTTLSVEAPPLVVLGFAFPLVVLGGVFPAVVVTPTPSSCL